jgi:hypothetical protein
VVAGDNPAASTDSRALGPLPRRSVLGVVVYRYGPPGRSSRLSAAAGTMRGVASPRLDTIVAPARVGTVTGDLGGLDPGTPGPQRIGGA